MQSDTWIEVDPRYHDHSQSETGSMATRTPCLNACQSRKLFFECKYNKLMINNTDDLGMYDVASKLQR